ncbi:hypothetical protein ACF0HZ_00630 [Leuconostoc suionicum]|uniref:hypothetical protein n=1 Tax=Leuconostoc suionicum TaxID=1511761 RepID=UPI0037495F96
MSLGYCGSLTEKPLEFVSAAKVVTKALVVAGEAVALVLLFVEIEFDSLLLNKSVVDSNIDFEIVSLVLIDSDVENDSLSMFNPKVEADSLTLTDSDVENELLVLIDSAVYADSLPIFSSEVEADSLMLTDSDVENELLVLIDSEVDTDSLLILFTFTSDVALPCIVTTSLSATVPVLSTLFSVAVLFASADTS